MIDRWSDLMMCDQVGDPVRKKVTNAKCSDRAIFV